MPNVKKTFLYLTYNVLMLLGLASLHLRGLVLPVYEGDITKITYLITIMFIGINVYVFWRCMSGGSGQRALPFSNTMVTLGLVGTLIGFIIALGGVNPDAAGSPDQIAGMVGTLLQGMKVAINTTLVGAIANLWIVLGVRLVQAMSHK